MIQNNEKKNCYFQTQNKFDFILVKSFSKKSFIEI